LMKVLAPVDSVISTSCMAFPPGRVGTFAATCCSSSKSTLTTTLLPHHRANSKSRRHGVRGEAVSFPDCRPWDQRRAGRTVPSSPQASRLAIRLGLDDHALVDAGCAHRDLYGIGSRPRQILGSHVSASAAANADDAITAAQSGAHGLCPVKRITEGPTGVLPWPLRAWVKPG